MGAKVGILKLMEISAWFSLSLNFKRGVFFV